MCTLLLMNEQATEMSVAELRKNLADVLNDAIQGKVTYVTNRGRRVALVGPLSLAPHEADEE